MADADNNISINISTTADTSGAEKAVAALKKVSSVEDIQNQTDKVKINQWAHYDLDAQLAKTGTTSEEVARGPLTHLSEGHEKATKGAKNMGMAATALSYQMQDFTVQVGAGQSAVTAFAQQAPQLIDGLKMANVLSGTLGMAMMGVAAVIPIVAFGGKALFEHFSALNGVVKIAPEIIAATAKHAEELAKIRFTDQVEDLDKEIAALKALRNDFDLTRAADDAMAKAQLTNAESVRKAWENLSEALGNQRDTIDEIAQKAEGEAKMRALEAAQAIDAEQQKAMLATRAASDAEFELSQREHLNVTLAANLVKDNARLAVLQDTRHELELIANKRVGFLDALLPDGKNGSIPWVHTPEANAAQKKLDNPDFKTELSSLEKTVEMLVTAKKEDDKSIEKLADDLKISEGKKVDTLAAVEENIQRIGEGKESKDLLASSEAVKEEVTALATGIDEHLAHLTPVTEAGKKTLETIKGFTADHLITLNEVPGVLAALVDLSAEIRSGSVTTTETLAATTRWLTAQNADLQKAKADIDRLNQQMSTR